MARQLRSESGKVGCLSIIGILIVLGAIGALIDSFKTPPKLPSNNASQSQPTKVTQETLGEKARSEAILGLQHFYDQQGLDVQVYEGSSHELDLSSDLFKDIGARDHAIQSLMEDHAAIKKMCKLGFWELSVGYSKGFLAGDVTKTVSLGCPEERQVFRKQEEALQERRNDFAAQIQAGFRKKSIQNITAVARSHALVLTSDQLFNTDEARQVFIAGFLQNVDTIQRICSIGFTRIEVRTRSGNSRSAHLPCSP